MIIKYLQNSFFFCSNKIETVRKDNVFGEEVTESEMDIIQQRVALQQRQFQEYEKREHIRKSKKIKTVYDYLSEEEIAAMLTDCNHNEVKQKNSFFFYIFFKFFFIHIYICRKKSLVVFLKVVIFMVFVKKLQ